MKKIILVAGARPNFVKIAPLYEELKKYSSRIKTLLVHTGQHYSQEMSDNFFRDLELPRPDISLGVGSASHAEQTAKIMIEFEKVLLKEKPDLVVVVGDVNSTLACSLTASKLYFEMPDGTKRRPLIAHVEAGLRSFDRAMPEEINRIVTDSLSDYLFTTSEDADKNLRNEGIAKKKIFFVGNVMIDTLLDHKEKAKKSDILRRLGVISKKYAVLTLHRPSNVDNKKTFKRILDALMVVSRKMPVIFPVHPRTQKQISALELETYFKYHNYGGQTKPVNSAINCYEPMGYLDFLQLMANAELVLTDSGGIQEETTILGVPCITLRENTERPITVTAGTNKVVGTDKNKIIKESLRWLTDNSLKSQKPKYWDGNAAKRIVKILLGSKTR